jgi:hypothetical protein
VAVEAVWAPPAVVQALAPRAVAAAAVAARESVLAVAQRAAPGAWQHRGQALAPILNGPDLIQAAAAPVPPEQGAASAQAPVQRRASSRLIDGRSEPRECRQAEKMRARCCASLRMRQRNVNASACRIH